MITYTYENMVAVDCDSTLVFTVTPIEIPGEPRGRRDGTCYNLPNGVDLSSYDFTLEDPYGHMGTIYLKKHLPNINLVKRCHARGDKLFVWSMAGAKWAALVAQALHMEQYFEFAMVKPNKYIDDKDVETWMGPRQWLDPEHEGAWQND